jgi:uncharacterized membrane protein
MIEFLLGHSLWAFRSGELALARGWSLNLLFVVAALGLIAIVATLLWRRHLGLWRAMVIGVLQWAFLTVLLLMLWRPVLNVERISEQQNVVAVLVDNSGSMSVVEKSGMSRREAASKALSAGVLQQLAASSALRLFSFADSAQPIDSLVGLKDGAPATQIGSALNTAVQMAASVPMAAIVLVSDGAETGDTLDETALARLAATGIPIHTVGVGPEQLENDLELEHLQLPARGVAGEDLRATVSVRHQGQQASKVRIYDRDELIAAKDVPLGAKPGLATLSMEFPAGKAGLRDLRFTVDAARGEQVLTNNSRHALVDVDDRRRAVLYLEGEPRWEYKFIRRAVEGNQSMRLASAVRATPNRYYRQGVTSGDEIKDGFPASRTELFGYDAVMIGSLEAAALSRDQHDWLKDFVDLRGGALLMLAGRDGLGDGGWGRVPIAKVLPTVLPTASTRTYGAQMSQVRLTDYGKESPIGLLDADPEQNALRWQELPTLADYQGIGTLRPGGIVLLEAIAADKKYPLLAMQRYGRGSAYLLGTATTWRWQMRLPVGDQRHEQFWKQLLHTLATPAPQRVSMVAESNVLANGAPIMLDAEVLDEGFKPIAGANVSITATTESGVATVAEVTPSGRNDGRYTATLPAMQNGLHRIELLAQAGKEEVGRALIHVRRDAGAAERFAAYQHRAMLERIAASTGGRYWSLDDLSDLPEAIRYSRAGIVERQTFDLWNIPLFLFLLFFLKAAEWLLRRYWRRL